MVDTSLTSLNESIRAFRQQLDLLQSSPVLTHSSPRRMPVSVFLPRFSGDNPAVWVLQAEKYFSFHNILSEHKLSLASFYFDGEALEWYRWLFRNKQLAGWDHFVDKLMIHFCSCISDTNREFLPISKQHEAEAQVCQLAEQDNISISLEIQYDLFAENSDVDHMFDKMPEKCNEVDSLDSTSVGSHTDTFEDMDNMPSLMISSVLSVYDQVVIDPNLSNTPAKNEALGIPTKVPSELPQYGNDQSSREGGQNVRTISYEPPPPQESTCLLLSAFDMHSDPFMNTFFLSKVVHNTMLVEEITTAKYRKVVVVGGEYNDCELFNDLGLFAMDEETVKHFRINTTRVFYNSFRWSCVIGCGHKVARSLIGDPNFSWTVIFKDFILKNIDKAVDNASHHMNSRINVFYPPTSPYYECFLHCSIVEFDRWNISDEKGPKREGDTSSISTSTGQ